jgi:tRNA pseudouridine32 synthase / 23S rRNA pseudouridine746 synthase
MTPDQLLARLLYRDGLMLILDKPAGLPVHAGPRGGVNLEQYLDGLRFGLPRIPSLAHRLDRDTSGCLVLGRHRKALAKLGKLFASGRVGKTYWAVVVGTPPAAEGRIDAPLAKRSTEARGWWMKVDPDGQTAATSYRLLGSANGLSWLELRPETGRTHQIRVHCAHIGCPVLGDPIYGDRSGAPTEPLHLHARRVVVPLYPNREAIDVTAPVPPHMLAHLQGLDFDPAQEPVRTVFEDRGPRTDDGAPLASARSRR